MKKLSYFTIALLLGVMVACSSKEKKEKGGDMDTTDMTMTVDPNASQQVSNATEAATETEMTSEDEVFATDLDDAKMEDAMKK